MPARRDKLGREWRPSSGAGKNGLPSKDCAATGRPLPLDPPAHLEKHGKEFYRQTAGLASSMGFADEADRFAFEAAAEVMDQLRAAQAHVKKYGQIILVSEGDHSVWKRNPSVGIVQRCQEFLRLCRSDLGLSPAARAKFATGASQDIDPFEELFSR